MNKKIMSAIGKGIEETAETKAGKCMLWIYQPRTPKSLIKSK